MGFRLEILKRCMFVAGVALVAVYSAEAQHAGRRPGETILFSSPAGDDVSSNMPSLAAKPPAFLDKANAAQSPIINFGATPQTEPPPGPLPPAISPAAAQRMQRQFDMQKNWALMTPEQILGLPTPEKILGVPDRDAFGRPKNQTVVEQFYERQEQLRARTNYYGYAATNSAPHLGFSDNQDMPINSKIWNPAGGGPGNSSLMNQFLDGKPDNPADSAQAPAGSWFNTFGRPARSRGPTPEQQAAAEQLQQLFQPQSPSGGAAKSSGFGGSAFSSPSTMPKPASGPFAPLRVGESYTPLSSGITMPVGIERLPGLLGPTNKPLLAPVPEWKPQPPPWMSPTPQFGVAPQRKL